MSIVRTEFDRSYYRLWKHWRKERARTQLRAREMLRHQRGGNLLEIGCGEGHLLRRIMGYYETAGIDISEYAIEKARGAVGDRASVADIEGAKLRPGYYHIIAAFNVLEHTRCPRRVIRVVFSALRAGGVFVGSVPNNSGVIGRLSTAVNNLVDRTHRSTYPPDAWRDHFVSAGFAAVSSFGEVSLWNWTYIRDPSWKTIAQNMVFVCIK